MDNRFLLASYRYLILTLIHRCKSWIITGADSSRISLLHAESLQPEIFTAGMEYLIFTGDYVATKAQFSFYQRYPIVNVILYAILSAMFDLEATCEHNSLRHELFLEILLQK